MNCNLTSDLPTMSEGAADAIALLGAAALDVTMSNGDNAEFQLAFRASEEFEPDNNTILVRVSSDLGYFILDLPMAASDWLCDILLPEWREQADNNALREFRTIFVIDALLKQTGLPNSAWTLLETREAPSSPPMPLALHHEEGAFLFRVWVLECDPKILPSRHARVMPSNDLSDLSIRLNMSLPPIKSAVRDLTEIELGDLFVLPGAQEAIPVQLDIGNSHKVPGSVSFDGVCNIEYERN